MLDPLWLKSRYIAQANWAKCAGLMPRLPLVGRGFAAPVPNTEWEEPPPSEPPVQTHAAYSHGNGDRWIS